MVVGKLVRKVLSWTTGGVDKMSYQLRAEWKAGRIAQGDKGVAAPRHPTDELAFREAQINEAAKKDLETKHQALAANLQQITIRSFDPPPQQHAAADDELMNNGGSIGEHENATAGSTSTSSSGGALPPRPRFPTRATEAEHHGGDAGYEYGFYEPPMEKRERNRITFGEAMEIIRLRAEIEPSDETQKVDEERASSARAKLDSLPATRRVSAEQLERVWQYYRPFDAARRREQKAVRKDDLDLLVEEIEDRPLERRLPLANLPAALRERLTKEGIRMAPEEERVMHLDEDERENLLNEMRKARKKERERLASRLPELEVPPRPEEEEVVATIEEIEMRLRGEEEEASSSAKLPRKDWGMGGENEEDEASLSSRRMRRKEKGEEIPYGSEPKNEANSAQSSRGSSSDKG